MTGQQLHRSWRSRPQIFRVIALPSDCKMKTLGNDVPRLPVNGTLAVDEEGNLAVLNIDRERVHTIELATAFLMRASRYLLLEIH